MKGTILVLATATAATLFLSGCGENEPVLSNWTCSEDQLDQYRDKCKKEGCLDKASVFFKQCRSSKLGKFNPEMDKLNDAILKCHFDGGFNDDLNYGKKCSAPFIKEREALLAKWKAEDE